MGRTVTIKFWQLHPPPDGGADFGASTRLAFAEPEDKRYRELEGSFYQLLGEPDRQGDVLLGDVIRLQGEAWPSRVKPGAKPQALVLGEGEYLGYHTGFIYDVKRQLIGF